MESYELEHTLKGEILRGIELMRAKKVWKLISDPSRRGLGKLLGEVV